MMTRGICLAIGIVIGAAVPLTVRAVAQPGRVIVTPTKGPSLTDRWVFIKDSKSGGCWIGYASGNPGTGNRDYALAVAPPSACD